MKLTLIDPAGGEHDLQAVLVEFANLHNLHKTLLGAYDERIAAIESLLGIEYKPAHDPDAPIDNDDAPTGPDNE